MYGTYVFHICILPYLCVMQFFHMLFMSKDIANLATFERSCMYDSLMESKERIERL